VFLPELNNLPSTERQQALATCCGATSWVEQLELMFPFPDEASLFMAASNVWYSCSENDWKEAFTHHPKIGDIDSLKKKFASTVQWASGEQSGVNEAAQDILEALTAGNELYEKKFGYIFIVCATGKSAEEMLHLLLARLRNDPQTEIKIAMGEQDKITKLRLEKLLT
jgi:2-oxo-4-hydroxy-4-carboxy-5-ureidoimidazoline decarboxylase